MSFQPEPVDLDALADTLGSLTEAQAEQVLSKAQLKSIKTRQQIAAKALSQYLGGSRTRS
jgi:hypothetical protein